MNILEQLSLFIFPRTRFKSAKRKIEIVDKIENGRAVRLLLVDGARESGMYLDSYGKREPLFEYMRTLKVLFNHQPGLKNCLLIGGGGFVLPRFFLNDHPERMITVVELEGGYVSLAEKFFELDRSDKRINIEISDGLSYIEEHSGDAHAEKYDIVIFDAYVGHEASKEILSEGSIKKIYSMLSPKGIYALNMINDRPSTISMLTFMTQESLKKTFQYTRIVPCTGGGNCILLASDRKL